jgi:hypothetical protein
MAAGEACRVCLVVNCVDDVLTPQGIIASGARLSKQSGIVAGELEPTSLPTRNVVKAYVGGEYTTS